MASYLDLVNGVLRRLRKEVAADINVSDYVSMIAELVNEAKREVEDSFNWEALYTKTSIATVAGTSTYTLTGYGDRARILFVLNDTKNRELFSTNHRWVERQRQFTSDGQGSPERWLLNGASSGDPVIEFWRTPNAAETINVHAFVPQADLTTAGDVLSVPSLPVTLKAYALAVSERGEDGGITENAAEMRASKALGDAIAIENSRHNHGIDTDWYVFWRDPARGDSFWAG